MSTGKPDPTPQDDGPRPGSRADAPTAAVASVLEAGLSRHHGRPRRVERIDRRPSAYSTSFTIEELDVTLDGGERVPLVLKDLAWRSLVGDAAAVRPRFLHDPRREIDVYRNLLAGRGLGTATCYGTSVDDPATSVDEAAGRCWLVLDRVAAAKLCHVGEEATWQQAARWLATLHATFADGRGPPDSVVRAAPLLVYDETYYDRWPRRAEVFLRRGGAGGTVTAAHRDLARVIDRYDRVVRRLAGLDRTLIHGDFYASNVLVRPATGDPSADAGSRVCAIDWELAAVGPSLVDLAALTAGRWSDAQRRAMVSAYRQGLVAAGTVPPPPGEMLESLDYCRLHVAFQWLGWASDWDAPADQSQDWLGAAVRAAARLGLTR